MKSTATTQREQNTFPLRSQYRHRPGVLIFAGLFVLTIMLTDRGRFAAQLPPVGPTDEKPDDDLQRLYSERRISQQLLELSAAAKRNETSSVRNLLTMLRAADPALMVAEPRGTFVPLHRGLIQRILEFSPSLRIDLQTDDAPALSALERSLEKGSPDRLIEVLHRHAGTDASWRAHLLLAAVHADRGHRHGAEYWLAPLLSPQAPPNLKTAAELLLSRMNLSVNGSRPPRQHEADNAPNDEQTLGELTPAASLSSGAPELMPRHLLWVDSLPLQPRAKRMSQALVKGASDAGFIPWSAWEPVIDATQVFIRTPDSISAFDARSGEQVWTRAIGRRRDVRADADDQRLGTGISIDDQSGNAAEINLLHRDELVGRMTSDPLRLFAVCTASDFQPTAPREDSIQLRFMMRRGQTPATGLRELAAFEKQTGRRLWTAGGVPIEQRFGNELATAWFAGPPAVSGRDLYSVIERDGQLQLVCLSAETGALRWNTTLVYPEIPITQDPVRQLVAGRILAAEGLVFATTTTGWVCAVDQVTRTTLWVRRLPLASSTNPRLRSVRNLSFLAQQMLPFNAVWRSETPILAADTLILFSSQSHQMTALNPADGQLRLKSDSGQARALLYHDGTMLVVASAESMTAWQIDGMHKLWTASRDQRDGVPVGSAVRRGEDLLVPMSDGSIRSMNLRNGQLSQVLTGIRPAYSSGGLFTAGEDVLSYAPDHLARLSSVPPGPRQGQDPLKQAQFLAASGRLPEAKVALLTASEDRLNADEIRRLKFRIAAGLFVQGAADADTLLREIRDLAFSDQEQAVSRYLLLDHALQQSAIESAGLLLETLQLDDAVLAVEIPDREVLLDALTSSAIPPGAMDSPASGLQVRRPLKAWVQQQLRTLLSDPAADRTKSPLTSPDRLSDADLLSLHAPSLREECLRRADMQLQTGTTNETTVHLLLEAYELSNEATSTSAGISSAANNADVIGLLDRLVSQLDERAADDTASEMSQTLLRVLRSDLTADASAESPNIVPDTRDLIADRWKELSDRSYTVVPVSTVSTMPFRQYNDRPVSPGKSRDPFLTAFDWSLLREPGMLTARSVSNPSGRPWSLNTRAAENLITRSRERLSRFGSVLVLQTGDSVSAFSATDQRWLWHRRMPDSRSGIRLTATPRRGFADFNSITQTGGGRDLRICGYGLRWICLHTNDSVEMIDLLSGDRLWRIPAVNSVQPVFACRSAVRVMNLRAQAPLLLNPLDGTPLLSSHGDHDDRAEQLPAADTGGELLREVAKLQRQEEALSLVTSAICSSDDAIVVWNRQTADGGIKALDWIHPVTLGLLRRVELPKVQFSQFLDESTLAGVTDDETLLIVDLRTGQTQTLSFADPAAPDAKMLVPERVKVFADAASFYVFESSDPGIPAPVTIPFFYGLNVESAQKEIRAVSRRSGMLAWRVPVPEGTFVCVDHSIEPMLLLVQISNPAGVAKAGGLFPGAQKSVIRGLSRTSGASLFTYPVVTRNPLPGLRIQTNREQSIDLDAFGNRARLVPQWP